MQFFLASKIVVEQGIVDARGARDGAGAGAGQTALGEDLLGSVENAFDRTGISGVRQTGR
jgi:hypothetical protein